MTDRDKEKERIRHKTRYQRPEVKAYHKAYREAHIDKIRAYAASHREQRYAWNSNTKEKRREYTLRMRYGLNKESFDAILYSQGGGCAICGTKDWGNRGPAVDHDHATGIVRGILCHPCNGGLGLFSDSIELLKMSISYLGEKEN